MHARGHRCMKDIKMTATEIAKQKEHIGKVGDDESKDEHDVKKQYEVMQELIDGLPDEQTRLLKFYEELDIVASTCNGDEMVTATDVYVKATEALAGAKVVLTECGKLEEEAPAAAMEEDEEEER